MWFPWCRLMSPGLGIRRIDLHGIRCADKMENPWASACFDVCVCVGGVRLEVYKHIY